MEVKIKNNEYGCRDIYLIDGNKELRFMFAGTGDLHWIITNNSVSYNNEYSYDYFEISKENYQIYYLFEKLFDDLKNINIFDSKEFPPYVETDEEKLEYFKLQEEKKNDYRKCNLAYYNNLYDDKSNVITWVSDNTAYEVANIFKLKKYQDNFVVEFFTQPYIDEYEREFNIHGMINVRIRNSGSRYDPFNIVFMRMYDNMHNIDDINDYGHQIHIEEYLYKSRKKIK